MVTTRNVTTGSLRLHPVWSYLYPYNTHNAVYTNQRKLFPFPFSLMHTCVQKHFCVRLYRQNVVGQPSETDTITHRKLLTTQQGFYVQRTCIIRAEPYHITVRNRQQTTTYQYETSSNKQSHLFTIVQQPPVGQGLLIFEISRSQSDTPQSVGLLWTSDRPDAETST